MSALSVLENDRIHDGANMSPLDAHKVNADDLFDEAKAWLNGDGVTSAAEAEAVKNLLDLARQGKKAADESRKTENEPFDTGKARVQAAYKPVLSRFDIVADTCKDALTPYNQKIEAEKLAKAEAARRDAEKYRLEADEAFRLSAGNVVERQLAEEKLELAKEAAKFASRTTKAAATGNGLRTRMVPKLVSLQAAVTHYWRARPAEFEALVCTLADKDAWAGKTEIPGFVLNEVKRAV